MKIQFGILLCLLAGCASAPTVRTVTTSEHAALRASLRAAADNDVRIGLEFLPPDDRVAGGREVTAEPVHRPAPQALPTTEAATGIESLLRPQPRFEAGQTHRQLLTDDVLAAIDDPIARETLHFCRDLIDTDRQRVEREVGLPFFGFHTYDDDHGQLLNSERQLLQDREQWCQEHGARMLNRPLRLLAKRLPLMQTVEFAIQDFRSRHVPLTEPYQQVHGDRRKLGRLSMRLRARRFEDPIEVVYIHDGVRVGTTRRRGKVRVVLPLSERLEVTMQASTDYESGEYGLRSDLIYRASPRMTVRVAAGDNMDFLTTSSLYSLFESPMDGKAGVVLYAVHTF